MPRHAISIKGKRYGSLTVLHMLDRNRHGNSRWLCRCDCGKELPMWYQHLTANKSKSCGCRIKPIDKLTEAP